MGHLLVAPPAKPETKAFYISSRGGRASATIRATNDSRGSGPAAPSDGGAPLLSAILYPKQRPIRQIDTSTAEASTVIG